MNRTIIGALALATLVLGSIAEQAQARATRVNDLIWANDHLYDTIVTPATFVSPPEHSTDTLYNFSMSGLMGQTLVSDAGPGDTDYNGGRWSVTIAVFTAAGLAALDGDDDGYIDAELTSGEAVQAAVDAGYVELMDTPIYFECPLLP